MKDGGEGGADLRPDKTARRTLLLAGGAHALHDGFTDMIYVMLPLWQAEFALSYGALALLRGIYAGFMAGFQMPVGMLARRCDARWLLAAGTALAALGYALIGLAGGFAGVLAALALSGIGSSTQHPLASAAVSRAYKKAARGPLGVYNFAGDLGKALLPAGLSLLLLVVSWRHALALFAAVGFVAAVVFARALPPFSPAADRPAARLAKGRGGFPLLMAIGILDSGVRMGLLTFLPFLLKEKGAGLQVVGVALGLVFIGGGAGKFLCGWLAARIGVVSTVLVTEIGTALAIFAVLLLPFWPSVLLLPFLGALLNGTSSALYGTVPELARPDRAEQAFALFYTGTIGSGALSPVLYGVLGDVFGAHWAISATALAALATCPLILILAPRLAEERLPDPR